MGEHHGSNVIFLNRLGSGKSLSPLRQLEGYWHALRNGDNIPRRADVDPRALDNILHDCFILQRVAPGVARLRVAGQSLNDLAGIEVRGMPITALFGGPSRDDMGTISELVFADPSIAELKLRLKGNPLRGAFEGRMVILPLRSAVDQVDRAIGALVLDRMPKRARQLEISDMRLTPINGTLTKPVAGNPHLTLVKG